MNITIRKKYDFIGGDESSDFNGLDDYLGYFIDKKENISLRAFKHHIETYYTSQVNFLNKQPRTIQRYIIRRKESLEERSALWLSTFGNDFSGALDLTWYSDEIQDAVYSEFCKLWNKNVYQDLPDPTPEEEKEESRELATRTAFMSLKTIALAGVVVFIIYFVWNL